MTLSSAATAPAARPPRRRGWSRRFLPPQHGAWAMLLLPYLAAVLTVGAGWVHAPLLGAWLAGYLLTYYALQAVRTRRPHRVRPQMVVYGALTVALGGLVAAARPEVLGFAPGYAALLAVNTGYAWRRRERALANDLASVAQSCLMVFLAAAVVDVPVRGVVEVFVAVLLYLTGTVLYVKTMIRERDNAGYRRASIAYHLLAVAVAAWMSVPLAAVFALLLARAWILGGRPVAPKHVGVLEIVNSGLVLAAILAS